MNSVIEFHVPQNEERLAQMEQDLHQLLIKILNLETGDLNSTEQ